MAPRFGPLPTGEGGTVARSPRWLELDALRGIACLSVMLYHYTHYYDSVWKHRTPTWIDLERGYYGVQLFFLISGFVIFASLRGHSMREFALLRFWRLFPAYWAATLFIFVLDKFFSLTPMVTVHGALSPWELGVNATMLANLFGVRCIDSSHWSLEFELLFYLQIALLFAVFRRKEPVVLAAMAGLALAATLWHQLILGHFGVETWMTVWWRSPTVPWTHTVSRVLGTQYAGLFLIGASLSTVQRGFWWGMLGVVVGVTAAGITWPPQDGIAVALAAILLGGTIALRPRILRNRLLVHVGTISYSVYLIHQKMGFYVIQSLERRGVDSNLAVCTALILSLCLGKTLYTLVEKPAYAFAKSRVFAEPSPHMSCSPGDRPA
jgi:peptidoglycan/LPS O-acetylase OafA/YrhL